MAIHVTGPGKFRPLVVAQRFGVVFHLGDRIPNSADSWVEKEHASRVSNDPDQPIEVFDDEDIVIDGVYRNSASSGEKARPSVVSRASTVLGPSVTRLAARALRWPVAQVRAKVEVTNGDGAWHEIATMRRAPAADGVALSARFRLQPGTIAFRIRVIEGILRAAGVYESSAWYARVRAAPSVLTFIAMGGSGSGGSSGTDSGSSSSSSSSSSSGSEDDGVSQAELLEKNRIVVDESKCGIDPTLIDELTTPQNIECNDLCASCINFIEFLGLRLLDDEGLADHMHSLRHKTSPSQADYCADLRNPNGIRNRIVLGKWENSEHEPFRPPDIKTFESILDEYDEAGGGPLIIVANSLAGAKLAATVKDHWRWAQRVTVILFVSWDATDLGGGIKSLGPRSLRVVNFFQRTPNAWFQQGNSIAEADVEFDLTGCLSHNAIVRSAFIHDRTTAEISDALAQVRALAREQ